MRKCVGWVILFGLFLQIAPAQSVDSLLQVLHRTDSLTQPATYVDLQLQIGEALLDEPDYPRAIIHFQRALLIAKQFQLQSAYLSAELQLAETYHGQGDYEPAVQFIERLLAHLPKDSLHIRGKALRVSGTGRVYLGQYSEAYREQMEAWHIYHTMGDSSLLARVEFGLGKNFFYQEQFDISRKHFENALAICKAIGLEDGMLNAYSAIGSILEQEGKLEEAYLLYERSFDMAVKMEDKEGMAWILLNLGSVLCFLERCEEGLEKLEYSKQLSQEIGDQALMGYIFGTQATIYKEKGEAKKALEYLQASYEIAKEDKDQTNIVSIYRDFADIHFELKNYEEYKEYTDRFQLLKDSLYNEDLIESMSSLKQNYEIQQLEQQQEITLLKKEQEIQRFRSRSRFWFFITLGLFSLFVLFVMYWKYYSQQEQNRVLQQKNEEISRQNELLRASNQDLERFAQAISHDLKEPLRNISGFTTLLQRELQDNTNSAVSDYMNFILSGTNQLSALLSGLLHYSKLGNQEKGQWKWIESSEVVDTVLQNLQLQIQQREAEVRVDILPRVYYHPIQLQQVFLNLISNALKYSSTGKTRIEISAEEDGGWLTFSIRDYGIGIPGAYHDRIFEVFQRLHDRGKYQGSGIGLSTCKKIIENNGGRIGVESEEGAGARFYFSIPRQKLEPKKEEEIGVVEKV